MNSNFPLVTLAANSAQQTMQSHGESELQTKQDCFTCRLIGSGALTATGFYALYSARTKAPGSRFGKGVVGLIGLGLVGAGAFRW